MKMNEIRQSELRHVGRTELFLLLLQVFWRNDDIDILGCLLVAFLDVDVIEVMDFYLDIPTYYLDIDVDLFVVRSSETVTVLFIST